MIRDGQAVVEAFVAAGQLHGVLVEPGELLELAANPSKFDRGDFEPGHFTASAVLVDGVTRRLLLIFHPKLDRWLQPGGHFDPPDASVAAAAAREAREETGVFVDPLAAVPMALEAHRIPAWGDEPSHLHLDLRFLFEVPEAEQRPAAELETRWFGLESREARGALGTTLARVDEILARRERAR